MSRISFLLAIAIAPLLSLAVQTILSGDSSVTFNCPSQETAEYAYMSYCPATTSDGLVLVGVSSIVDYYLSAPASYNTVSGGVFLNCQYAALSTATVPARTCTYYAGGGSPLTALFYNPAGCPTPSATVPQPSAGTDYRKRDIVPRMITTHPSFVCPWSTSNANEYIYTSQIGTGLYAPEDNNLEYACTYALGGSNFICRYTTNAAAGPVSGSASCPVNLCDVLTTGTGNMRRGIWVGDDPVNKRQVDPRILRQQRV